MGRHLEMQGHHVKYSLVRLQILKQARQSFSNHFCIICGRDLDPMPEGREQSRGDHPESAVWLETDRFIHKFFDSASFVVKSTTTASSRQASAFRCARFDQQNVAIVNLVVLDE